MSKKDKQIKDFKEYITYLEKSYTAALKKLIAIETILNPDYPKL